MSNALLDVSEVLSDPFLASGFTVIRRQETVNTFGESTVVETRIEDVGGVVCQASPNDLQRLAESDQIQNAISIVTTFRLRGPSEKKNKEFKPDVVLWEGGYYIVKILEPYVQYGEGFVEAIATSLDFIGDPPK